MLRLSETPQALLEQIAADLLQVRDPWARHWLVFPGIGRSDLILQRWAQRAGIASHSQTIELRTLLEQVAAGQKPRFNFESLKLSLAEALPDLSNHPHPLLPRECFSQTITAAALEWAGALASAMDDTLLCRTPEKRWEMGSFLEALAGHPRVLPVLQNHLGAVSVADFQRGFHAWIQRWEQRGGVPHLWVQLDAGLPHVQFERLLQLLELLAERAPERVHLYALTPSQEYWADCLTRARSRNSGAPGTLDPDLSPGGVLWAFGRNSQALHRQLAGTLLAEGEGGVFCRSAVPQDNLLGRLQRSCRNASPLNSEEKYLIRRGDHSLTVHSCRSPLRELETCRDRILQALEEIPDLKPEEVVVLLANAEEQAPFVEAAFGKHCPHRMVGVAQAASSPLTQAITLLLAALRGRSDVGQMRSLIEHPLVAAKFGFEEPDGNLQSVVDWLVSAQFRWGIHEEHRHRFQGIEEHRWNLQWALQRLSLGAVLPPTSLNEILTLPGSPHPTVPLERTSGLGLQALANLARFVSHMEEAHRFWSLEEARPLSEWVEQMQRLVETMFDFKKARLEPEKTSFQKIVFGPLAEIARGLQSQSLLEPEAFVRLLQQRLSLLSGGSPSGRGGTCVADLRQYAGVPARVIVIAGLNEDSFPARDERPSWHPLAKSSIPGDPSRREADRHAFLLALLACEERFILSYLGGSDSDAKERPPSTVIADLLQILDGEILDSDASSGPAHQGIVFRHLLNGFSVSPDESERNRRPFLERDREAAFVLSRRKGLAPAAGLWSLPSLKLEPRQFLSIAELRQLLKEPAAVFLRSLGVALPEEETELPEGDLVELDGLGSWKIRDALLEARVEGRDEQAIQECLEHAGHLPRGRLGSAFQKKILEHLPPPPEPLLSSDQRFQKSIRLHLPGTVPGGAVQVEGQLSRGWYLDPARNAALYYSASSQRPEKVLPLYVEALCLAASGEGLDGTLRMTLHFGRSQLGPFELPPRERALVLLSELVALFELARARALPFWPNSAEKLFEAFSESGPLSPGPGMEGLLEGYRRKWEAEDSFDQTQTPDARKPSTRFAFRGCADPFRELAPCDACAFLPEPESPLSWRIFVWILSWLRSATFHSPCKASTRKK
jgi:exodeoxyribonuclease V gamma subunit